MSAAAQTQPSPASQVGPDAAPSSSSGSRALGQADAAAQFDAAVAAYKSGEFTRAAELFLVADGLAPSVTALSNALAAARRARVPLLMARAGQRGLTRSGLSDADRRSARSMLDQVEPQLARLELRCAAAPCSPSLDGVEVAQGVHYAEPGPHRARAAEGAEVSAECAAGQLCMLTLPAPPPVSAPAASEVASASVETEATAPAQPAPPPVAPSADSSPRWKRRLPLGVFIASGASALLFGGLAVWQGMAALDAKQSYKDGDDWDDDVRAKARRSDAFMITGIALAGVAAATAIWWVDWDAQSRSQLALLPEGGATLTTRRRF
ncbi:MAG TPA: hypothetical protein VFZ61_06055 [Polyangiales bacterium]